MDRQLKSGTSTLKESSNYSSNQQTENNEISNGEPPSILKDALKKKARKTRKYDKEYLKFGFSWTGDEKEPIPLCVICFENLTNESMKPSNLKRHFETNNEQYKINPSIFLKTNLRI